MWSCVDAYSASVSGTVVNVSTNPVRIDTIVVVNNTASLAYLQMFNAIAANVTLGVTVPDHVIPMPGSGGAVINCGGKFRFPGGGASPVALSLAGTTTRSGATTAPIDVFIVYN